MATNRKIPMLALAAGLVALSLLSGRVQAQGTAGAPAGAPAAAPMGSFDAANIGVVDVPYLVQNSAAGKAARTQIEKLRAEYAKSLKSEESRMRKLNQDIVEQRATLSDQAYEKRVEDFRQKFAAYRRDAQTRQLKLEEASQGAARKIEAAVVQIVGDVAKQRKLEMVLSRQALIGGPEVADITQDVLARLNQRLPSVKVEVPK
ncbi:MAG TPA: OmpH family outer membrane protein [Alphaproteobacteria bacterium]|nr:OmpH family outer membrane protein [Alphaproteobacteria bacterium]